MRPRIDPPTNQTCAWIGRPLTATQPPKSPIQPPQTHTQTQVVFPDHVPEDVHEQPVNIDLTPVVKGEKGDGRVLVDSANKAYFAN